MLHILNKRPESICASNMLRVVGEQDDVILIEQAVLAGLAPSWPGFMQCKGRIHLLSDDLACAGLLETAREHGFSIMDMADFLALTERHTQSVSWY